MKNLKIVTLCATCALLTQFNTVAQCIHSSEFDWATTPNQTSYLQPAAIGATGTATANSVIISDSQGFSENSFSLDAMNRAFRFVPMDVFSGSIGSTFGIPSLETLPSKS